MFFHDWPLRKKGQNLGFSAISSRNKAITRQRTSKALEKAFSKTAKNNKAPRLNRVEVLS